MGGFETSLKPAQLETCGEDLNLDNDWEGRFTDQATGPPAISNLIRSTPTKIAATYWLAVLLVFFGLQRAGFDMIGDGAIPIAALTAPGSLLAIAVAISTTSATSQALLRPFIS